MRKNKARQREMALERVKILLEQSASIATVDMGLARRQASIARTLCLRFNLKLPYHLRQVFCHGCKSLILPGVNARIRLSKKRKSITITCLDCNFIYRKILKVDGGNKPKYPFH